MTPFQRAFKASIPVLFAYFPMGMVYGLVSFEEGLPWIAAILSSLLVFGGSLQFLGLSVVAAGGGLPTLAVAALPLAVRNSFYGLSLLDRLRGHWVRRGYLAFGLVDATYLLLASGPRLPDTEDGRYCLWLTALIHAYWVIGTAAGVLCAFFVPLPLAGCEFTATALLAILAVDFFQKQRQALPFVVGGAACAVAWLIAPQYLLIVGIGIVCAVVGAMELKR